MIMVNHFSRSFNEVDIIHHKQKMNNHYFYGIITRKNTEGMSIRVDE